MAAVQVPEQQGSRRSSTSKKLEDVEIIETAEAGEAEAYLQRFELLRGKSQDELAALNNSLVQKLDWKFLPCITWMLLMK
jgi:hypothetical protein